jgi:signal peptidase I
MSVTSGTKTENGLGETVRVVIHALLIALVIRTFLFQPFNIPSGSMKATLLVGDYLFVSKYSYGYSHFSIPLSPPLFSGRVFGSEPNRGDVVVFRLPKDTDIDYIKRVIGLPGDRLRIDHGRVYVNDRRLPEPYVPLRFEDDRSVAEMTLPPHEYWMMGDHRSISSDSRDFGPVDRSLIYGKAVFVYWPMEQVGVVR